MRHRGSTRILLAAALCATAACHTSQRLAGAPGPAQRVHIDILHPRMIVFRSPAGDSLGAIGAKMVEGLVSAVNGDSLRLRLVVTDAPALSGPAAPGMHPNGAGLETYTVDLKLEPGESVTVNRFSGGRTVALVAVLLGGIAIFVAAAASSITYGGSSSGGI
ncbi:MAG: hypothetical protein ABJD07_03470 [Gemmatimonadaceae bacterium]